MDTMRTVTDGTVIVVTESRFRHESIRYTSVVKEAQRQLIRGLLDGHSAAGHEFLREWAPRIKVWIRSATSADNVDDYSQEILLYLCQDNWSVLSNWNGLFSDDDWSPHSLEAYLRTITRRKVIDLWRADQRQLPEGGEYREVVDEYGVIGRNPERASVESQQQEIVRHLIEQLSVRDKKLLILWMQGEPDRHTARLLRMTENNVRQRRHYLLKRLGNQFDARRGED
jgi:RNA polymerase sigma factor (sigma-70 family)